MEERRSEILKKAAVKSNMNGRRGKGEQRQERDTKHRRRPGRADVPDIAAAGFHCARLEPQFTRPRRQTFRRPIHQITNRFHHTDVTMPQSRLGPPDTRIDHMNRAARERGKCNGLPDDRATSGMQRPVNFEHGDLLTYAGPLKETQMDLETDSRIIV
jgi:hypothetical protein